MNRLQSQRIYFLGIGGIAMGGLALALHKLGCVVAGADRSEPYDPMKSALKQAQIPIATSWDEHHIESFRPDLVVIGNVCTPDNPMIQWTLNHQVPFEHMAKMAAAMASLGKTRHSVVVAGTHGKTTTALLLRHMFSSNGLRTGSFIGGFDANYVGGVWLHEEQDVFVFEGDEYDCAFFDKQPKLMYYGGHVSVLTSCEHDHVDIYPTMRDMVKAYGGWIEILPHRAKLWVSQSLYLSPTWQNQLSKCVRPDTQVYTYGPIGGTFSSTVGYRVVGAGGMEIFQNKTSVAKHTSLRLSHEGFMQSVCVAYGIGHALGLKFDQIRAAVDSFPGVLRRFTPLRQEPFVLIDDFGHHPTAVGMNLHALRRLYPGHRLCVVFEPRSATSRRNILLSEWKHAFRLSDLVLLAPIYKGSSMKDLDSLNISEICTDMRREGKLGEMATSMADLQSKAVELVRKGDVWVLFSNGDLSALASTLKNLPL